MACISYQPSEVSYRKGYFARMKLLNMRKALLDKCEYIINNQSIAHAEHNLKTEKIFKDLIQFYNNMDKSIFSSNSIKNEAHSNHLNSH